MCIIIGINGQLLSKSRLLARFLGKNNNLSLRNVQIQISESEKTPRPPVPNIKVKYLHQNVEILAQSIASRRDLNMQFSLKNKIEEKMKSVAEDRKKR